MIHEYAFRDEVEIDRVINLSNLYDRLNDLKLSFKNEEITYDYFMKEWDEINNQIDKLEV